MGNNDFSHTEMSGWYNGWHWLTGFHGILLFVSLVVIVIVGFALVRDWRREHTGDTNITPSERRLQR